MRTTFIVLLALLVASTTVLLVDHYRRPKLSDYGIKEGMSYAEVEACMKRPADSSVPRSWYYWYNEGITVRFNHERVTRIFFEPPPTVLEKLQSWFRRFWHGEQAVEDPFAFELENQQCVKPPQSLSPR